MCPHRLKPRFRRRPDHASLASWIPLLTGLTWPQRLVVLEHIDDQLLQEFGAEASRPISQSFAADLIGHLRVPALTCREQALIYLNSGDAAHVDAARAFLSGLDA